MRSPARPHPSCILRKSLSQGPHALLQDHDRNRIVSGVLQAQNPSCILRKSLSQGPHALLQDQDRSRIAGKVLQAQTPYVLLPVSALRTVAGRTQDSHGFRPLAGLGKDVSVLQVCSGCIGAAGSVVERPGAANREGGPSPILSCCMCQKEKKANRKVTPYLHTGVGLAPVNKQDRLVNRRIGWHVLGNFLKSWLEARVMRTYQSQQPMLRSEVCASRSTSRTAD
jgi:hypothetical protein